MSNSTAALWISSDRAYPKHATMITRALLAREDEEGWLLAKKEIGGEKVATCSWQQSQLPQSVPSSWATHIERSSVHSGGQNTVVPYFVYVVSGSSLTLRDLVNLVVCPDGSNESYLRCRSLFQSGFMGLWKLALHSQDFQNLSSGNTGAGASELHKRRKWRWGNSVSSLPSARERKHEGA